MTRYSNLYLAERRFGGPEEGGWWYDHSTFLRGVEYTETAHAEMVAEANAENEGHPLSSVLSTGLFVVAIEDEPGQTRPAEKPTYE